MFKSMLVVIVSLLMSSLSFGAESYIGKSANELEKILPSPRYTGDCYIKELKLKGTMKEYELYHNRQLLTLYLCLYKETVIVVQIKIMDLKLIEGLLKETLEQKQERLMNNGKKEQI